MSVAARRLRAGDVILASGSLLILIAILAHVASAPVAPAETGPGRGASTPASYEPPSYRLNSRSIRSWKDLPVHVVHRPHWISGREHPKTARGTGLDYQLRTAELHLEVLGFDAESVRLGLDMVNRLDAALLDVPPGSDATTRLIRLAAGGKDAVGFAGIHASDGGEEAVRVRAIALLAARGEAAGVSDFLRAIARSAPEAPVRSAAGISLLWMGRQVEVAEWVETEQSPAAVADFFDSIQSGVHRLEDKRPPKGLIFMPARAVESSPLVDALMEGPGPARWDTLTRAKMYGVAALYGGERAEVGAWMEAEYARASDDLVRASILFSAPGVANSRGLEEKAIEVARAGGPGYLVRTALFSLGRFRTDRAFRALMEVVPKSVDDTAAHAVRALASLAPWHGREIEPLLRDIAAGHPNRTLREEAAAALRRTFGDPSR